MSIQKIEGKNQSQEPPSSGSLLDILIKATEKNPRVMRVVWGVVGLITAGSLVLVGTQSSFELAILLFVFMLCAAILVVVFGHIQKLNKKQVNGAAQLMVWVPALAFVAIIGGGLSSTFFNWPMPLQTTFVEVIARRNVSSGLAPIVRNLSSSALKQVAKMNTAFHRPWSFDSTTNTYTLSWIPEEVTELDKNQLIAWSTSRSDYEKVLAKYKMTLPTKESEHPKWSFVDVEEADRQVLTNFSYSLNSQGVRVYESMVDTLLRLIGKTQ